MQTLIIRKLKSLYKYQTKVTLVQEILPKIKVAFPNDNRVNGTRTIISLNVYTQNIKTLEHMKKTPIILKGVDKSTIKAGNFKTPLLVIEQVDTIRKEVDYLNYIINQFNLINIYRTLHPATSEYTSLSIVHGTLTKIDHMLSHKSLNNLKE